MYAHLSDLRIDLEWAEDAAWRRNNGRPYLSWADFDKLHNKGANRPWFTYFLLFVCSVMMIVEFGLGERIEVARGYHSSILSVLS